jgi:hypothetical protein
MRPQHRRLSNGLVCTLRYALPGHGLCCGAHRHEPAPDGLATTLYRNSSNAPPSTGARQRVCWQRGGQGSELRAASCVEECRGMTDNGANDDYQYFHFGVGKRRARVTAKRRRADADDITSGSPGLCSRIGLALRMWQRSHDGMLPNLSPRLLGRIRSGQTQTIGTSSSTPGRPTRLSNTSLVRGSSVSKSSDQCPASPSRQRLEPED